MNSVVSAMKILIQQKISLFVKSAAAGTFILSVWKGGSNTRLPAKKRLYLAHFVERIGDSMLLKILKKRPKSTLQKRLKLDKRKANLTMQTSKRWMYCTKWMVISRSQILCSPQLPLGPQACLTQWTNVLPFSIQMKRIHYNWIQTLV